MRARLLRGCGLAALLSLACATPGGEQSHGHPWAEGWRELTTEHFRVDTNVEGEDAERAVRDLERIRAALVQSFGQRFDPPGRVEVMLFAATRELSAFTGPNKGGFTDWRDAQVRIVMALPDTAELEGTLVQAHELTHYLSSFVLLRQPRWVAEGFACYFESATLDEPKHEVIFGLPSRHMLGMLQRYGVAPLDSLWDWKGGEDELREGQRYASAWVWVHYLLDRQTERFARFQEGLMRAEDPRTAFQRAFAGVDLLALQLDVRMYLSAPLPAHAQPFADAVPPVKTRPLSSAHVHALLAQLWLSSRGPQLGAERRGYARTELALSRAEDPHELLGQLLEADLLERAQRVERVRALVNEHPREGEAWTYFAELLAEDGTHPDELREAVGRALALWPDRAPVLEVAAVAALERGAPREALPYAERAAQLAPWSAHTVATYAQALAGSGQCAAALAAEARTRDLLGLRTTGAAAAALAKEVTNCH